MADASLPETPKSPEKTGGVEINASEVNVGGDVAGRDINKTTTVVTNIYQVLDPRRLFSRWGILAGLLLVWLFAALLARDDLQFALAASVALLTAIEASSLLLLLRHWRQARHASKTQATPGRFWVWQNIVATAGLVIPVVISGWVIASSSTRELLLIAAFGAPTPYPTATASPTITPMPTATLPPLHEFAPAGPNQLPPIYGMVATQGRVWFATDSGLWEHTGAITRLIDPAGPLRAVALDPSGTEIWAAFDTSKGDAPGWGLRYAMASNSSDIVMSEGGLVDPALSLRWVESGVWLGTNGSGVWRVDPASGWVPVLNPPSDESALQPFRVEALATSSDASPTVWADDGTLLFGWQTDRWYAFHRDNTSQRLDPPTVVDLAYDGRGRLWIAQAQGLLTLPADVNLLGLATRPEQWQTCRASDVPGLHANQILGLTVGPLHDALWMATDAGLARVTLSAGELAPECGQWGTWQTWPATSERQGFWQGQLLLTVDESSGGEILWVAQKSASTVLYVRWP